MPDWRVCHYTSPYFVWWAYILYGILTVISCPATQQKMMFSPLPPPEQVVLVVSIVELTMNVQACGEHHFCFGNTLLLAWNVHGFGGLLHRLRNGMGQTHHLFYSW